MKRTSSFWFISCLLLLLTGTTLADDVLFVKNQWSHRLHIWANGVYQGFVDPGQVAYMPQEGFVTEDSGIQADGSLKMNHAYGGWPVRGTFSIEGASAPFEQDGQQVSFYSQGSQNDGRGYKQWAFGTSSLAPPEGVETEHAVKMRQLREPQDILNLIAKGTTEVTSGGSPISGLANNSGTSYPLKFAGLPEAGGDSFTSSVGMTLIRVDKGYYLAATEVTQAQWQAVMGGNPSQFQGQNRPVEQVSWDDAMAFCQRLTEKDRASGKLPQGHSYTLPTEDQWEYACRAGTTGDYAGNLDEMAWYDANSGSQTHDVATKKSNAWGFYDMHGNVWEWCLNTYNDGRAIRGGSWYDNAEYCRSGFRSWLDPGDRNSYLGFRPAAVPSP